MLQNSAAKETGRAKMAVSTSKGLPGTRRTAGYCSGCAHPWLTDKPCWYRSSCATHEAHSQSTILKWKAPKRSGCPSEASAFGALNTTSEQKYSEYLVARLRSSN